jgi:hypothetical protein
MFRRLFGNKSEFDDEVKSKFVTLMSDILKIQTIPTGGKSTKDERDNLKRKALGYVYGFIDAALQVRGQDMDVSVGVPITFQVIRMLWPDHVNECMDYLIKNIKSDPLLQAGVMHGGQQYLDFHNHNRHPFGLGIFLIEEDKGLNDTSRGQKSLTSSRQMLRYSADARWDDLAWMEFEWIPGNLIANWVSGVKAKHERHGWESMAGILWDQDTMVFIGRSNGLMEMLKVATKSRKSSVPLASEDSQIGVRMRVCLYGQDRTYPGSS